MTNQELLQKMKEDMELRGFSHWTKSSYEGKAKDIMRYFSKPMEEVTIEEFIGSDPRESSKFPLYFYKKK